ncbi:MAG: hypothetical protein U5N85_22440 [Arcicella sp.]|nr:hypothetical protein [Arcicella sp.]
MDKALNINKINSNFYSWRVADARVVGGKNTNNGWKIVAQEAIIVVQSFLLELHQVTEVMFLGQFIC